MRDAHFHAAPVLSQQFLCFHDNETISVKGLALGLHRLLDAMQKSLYYRRGLLCIRGKSASSTGDCRVICMYISRPLQMGCWIVFPPKEMAFEEGFQREEIFQVWSFTGYSGCHLVWQDCNMPSSLDECNRAVLFPNVAGKRWLVCRSIAEYCLQIVLSEYIVGKSHCTTW